MNIDIITDRSNIKFPVYKSTINRIDELWVEELKDWCEIHCKSKYRTEQHMNYNVDSIDFYLTLFFVSEEDAAAFKLKWS